MDITIEEFVSALWQGHAEHFDELSTPLVSASHTNNRLLVISEIPNQVRDDSVKVRDDKEPMSSSLVEMSSSGLTRRSLSLDIPSLLHYGHLRGWLEDQDEREPHSILVKRTAARILHQFMRIELKIPDVDNISSADVLQDLYTCRTCVNHVAQAYLQGLMESEEEEKNGSIIQIFNMMKPVTAKEAEEIFRRLHSLYSN